MNSLSCPRCEGNGEIRENKWPKEGEMIECAACKGKGFVENPLDVLLITAEECSGEIIYLDMLESPNWSAAKRFYWDYYVDIEIQSIWEFLSVEARLVAFIVATNASKNDDLDW